MKKLLGVSILAVLLVACADSGQGGAAGNQTDTNSSANINVNEPGVAPEPGTKPAVSNGEMPAKPEEHKGSNSVTPSSDATVVPPANPAIEQGTQTLPEPRTGDDANPDNNPRK